MAEIPGGWIRDKPDPRDILYKATRKRGAGMDLDLRKTGFLPPIYQQYDTNACTSMVIGAAIEYMNMKEKKPVFKPSKLFMYWNGRVLGECTDKDDGAELRDVMKSLSKWGVAPDADFPFLLDNLMKRPPEKAYADAQREIITKYRRIASTVKDVTAVLSQGQPIIFGAETFKNFNNEETYKTGYFKMPQGKHTGGHCMLIVGIQPGYVIVRNSWGLEWGDHGYGYFPIDYMENDNLTGDFWTIDVV
jgi:C1A family cysteine protease